MTDQQLNNPPAYTLPTASPSVQGTQTSDIPAGFNSPMTAVPCNIPGGHNPPVIQMQAGYPLQMYAYPKPATVYGSYLSKRSRSLGIAHITIGALCIVFNAVGIGFDAILSVASIGIWGGILFIVTGAFGISAAKLRTKCKITTFMVLCIVSAAVTIALFVCAVMGATIQGNEGYYSYICRSYYYYDYYYSNACRNVAIAMNSLLAILAVAAAIPAIWGSVLCCKVYGCCKASETQIMMSQEQYAGMSGGQPMIIIPLSQINFGGQMVAYAPGYSAQQTGSTSAPPYPLNYEPDTAPLVPQSNTNINENVEKQPL
jgi:hypothetical protein